MKKYIDLLVGGDTLKNATTALHYWSVETTIESFVAVHKELGLIDDTPIEKNSLDDLFPLPSLGRTYPTNVPVDISINTDKNIINYSSVSFVYPEGTTHFQCELFHKDDFMSRYNTERTVPVVIKIDGDINSKESTWYLYKVIDGVEGWVELEKGTRVISKIHSIDFLKNYTTSNEIAETTFIIDKLISKLPNKSLSKIILALYVNSLTDFFEEKHSYEKLVEYFKFSRVFPIYDNDDVELTTENLNGGSLLNQLLFHAVVEPSFANIYKEVLNEK